MDIKDRTYTVIAKCNTFQHVVMECDTEEEAVEVCKKFIEEKSKSRILRKSWRGAMWKVSVYSKIHTEAEIPPGKKTRENLRGHLERLGMTHLIEELTPDWLRKDKINERAKMNRYLREERKENER